MENQENVLKQLRFEESVKTGEVIKCINCANKDFKNGQIVCKSWYFAAVKEDGYCYRARPEK